MKQKTLFKTTGPVPGSLRPPFSPAKSAGPVSSAPQNTIFLKKNKKKQTTASVSGTSLIIKAQKKFWDDIHQFFPKDGRKLAGTGYDEAGDPLRADFTEGVKGKMSYSAPIIYIGKKYLDEADKEKRKSWIKLEIAKIDVWRVKTGRVDDLDRSNAAILSIIKRMSVVEKMELLKKMGGKKGIANSNMMELIKRKIPATP